MGANVIDEPKKGLNFALERGYSYLEQNNRDYLPVLTTDADCFPAPSWAKIMTNHIREFGPGGGEVFGPVCYFGNGLTSFLLNIYSRRRDRKLYQRGFVKARGPNAVILPDESGRILDALSHRLDPQFVTGIDELVRDVILGEGGRVDRIWDGRALVLSKDDRRKSLVKLLMRRFGFVDFEDSYKDWYIGREGKRYVSPHRPKADW